MIIKKKVAVFLHVDSGEHSIMQIYTEGYVPQDNDETVFLGFKIVEIDTNALTQE